MADEPIQKPITIVTDPRLRSWLMERYYFLISHPPVNWDAVNAILDQLGYPHQGPPDWKPPEHPPKHPPEKPPEKPKPKPPEPPKKPEPKPPEPPKKPEPKPPAPPAQPKVKPELVITRTKYPKWWNDEGVAAISLSSPGSQLVISARGDYTLYVATIVLTVDAECDITFTFGSAGHSGAMHFGGDAEPKGIVIAGGNSPTPCGSGSFMVTGSSDDPANIGGFVSYYLWKKETPQQEKKPEIKPKG